MSGTANANPSAANVMSRPSRGETFNQNQKSKVRAMYTLVLCLLEEFI
jgi:hypothetical protein